MPPVDLCRLSYSTFATSCSSPSPTSYPADANFSISVGCSTSLAPASAIAGDEILLVFHRAGADVRARVGTSHPVPSSTLRDFNRLDGVNATAAPAPSTFTLQPADLGLTDALGRTLIYPGTHYVDVSPRAPAPPWTITITITGTAPVVIAAPPPLPKY